MKVFNYLPKKNYKLIFFSLVFIIVQVWLDLTMPDYMSEITTLIQTEGSAMSDIWTAGGMMLVCAVGSMVASIIVGYFAAKVAANLAAALREQLFDKVQSFSSEEINQFSTASLITRSTNDVTQVQTIVAMGLQMIIKAPITAAWAITKIAGKSWQWSLSTGIAVVILLLVILSLIVLVLPKNQKIQALTDNLNEVTRENLTGLRVVRAYNAENYQQKKFDQANAELTNTNLFVSRATALMMPTISLISNGLSLAIYWIGAYLIDAADIASKVSLFSDMVVFTSYAMQIIMAFMMLVVIFIMLPRALVSARRINEVLDTKLSLKEGTIAEVPTRQTGTVEFRNVSFKYPNAESYVLKNINFSAKKGEVVAFIGSTGSGKSTLVNLVPRFFDVSEGKVLVDNIDVREYTSTALNNKLGYVSQKAVIFSGTVASNINYGNSLIQENSTNTINHALEIAQANDFVSKMDQGIDSAISQGGTNISGGQKQRLSIARAIHRKPEIYIFDDSFSALDYKTDRVLRSALRKETGDVTSLIVAQRVGTIMDADKIIVLDKGEMVGIGTHQELLKTCEIYQEIAESQLSKEELAHA